MVARIKTRIIASAMQESFRNKYACGSPRVTLNTQLIVVRLLMREHFAQAKQEEAIEKNLILLTTTWDAAYFILTPAGQSEVKLLSLSEECSELLEEQQMLVQNMMASKWVTPDGSSGTQLCGCRDSAPDCDPLCVALSVRDSSVFAWI